MEDSERGQTIMQNYQKTREEAGIWHRLPMPSDTIVLKTLPLALPLLIARDLISSARDRRHDCAESTLVGAIYMFFLHLCRRIIRRFLGF